MIEGIACHEDVNFMSAYTTVKTLNLWHITVMNETFPKRFVSVLELVSKMPYLRN